MVVGTKCDTVGGLQFLKGDPVTVPAQGKVTVIELWAKWCGPCRQIFPHLTEIYQARKDKGLVVVGISIENDDKLSDFVRQEGDRMGYTVAVDKKGAAVGLMTRAGVTGIPHAFVVDRTNTFVYSGHPGKPEFVQKVDEALAAAGAGAGAEKAEQKALPLITATADELLKLSIKELKAILADRKIDFSDLNEKRELVDRVIERCKSVVYYA